MGSSVVLATAGYDHTIRSCCQRQLGCRHRPPAASCCRRCPPPTHHRLSPPCLLASLPACLPASQVLGGHVGHLLPHAAVRRQPGQQARNHR